MRLIAISGIVVLSLQPVFSQSVFLDKGQSAFQAGVEADFNLADASQAASSYEVMAGYSYQGLFDVGAGYTYLLPNEDVLGEDVSLSAIKGKLGVNPLKPTSELPIGVSLEAMYEHFLFGGDSEIDRTQRDIAFGGDLFALFLVGDLFNFQPTAGYRFHMLNSTSELPASPEVESSSNNQSIELSIPFILPMQANKLVLTPKYELVIPEEGDNANTISFSVKYIGLL